MYVTDIGFFIHFLKNVLLPTWLIKCIDCIHIGVFVVIQITL